MIAKIIGEIIGFIAVAENILIFSMLRREKILKFKFLSDLLWFGNMVCLGAYTGAVLNLVAMVRETVFYYRGRKKFASHILWLPVFCCLTLLSPILEYLGRHSFAPITLLPTVGSMLMVYALYQSDPKRTAYIAFATQSLWLAYAAYTGNISAAAANVLQIVSVCIGLVREHIIGHKAVVVGQNTEKEPNADKSVQIGIAGSSLNRGANTQGNQSSSEK